MSHTIILVQPTKHNTSRTYYDFSTVGDACSGICRIFENKLKDENPSSRNITYDVRDLFTWLDGLSDVGILVLDSGTKAYSPFDREWLKQKVLNHLKKAAQH